MDLFFKITISSLVAVLIFCFVGLFHSVQFDLKCREQGGMPVNGVCLKVNPSIVIEVVQ
jgi:hypothetical protein